MKKYFTVGVAGHVDHGKTALVKCLTGVDTDRKAEEKRRGVSIESSVAKMQLPSGMEVALIDIPGHTDYMKNTIRGLCAVDLAMLVVAADDGVMPQTLEHLKILEFFRIKSGLVVLNKADLVDGETLAIAELEIAETVKGTFLEEKPVVAVSTVKQKGLSTVGKVLEREVSSTIAEFNKAPFRLWIDQMKSIHGFGTIVTGTVLSGVLRQDEFVELLPSGINTQVRSLEYHGERVEQAEVGQRVGVNLHKVALKDVRRGMLLSKPDRIKCYSFVNAEFHILKNVEKPIWPRQRVKLYIGTSVTNAMVVIMDREKLMPGESGLVQFRFMHPVPCLPQDPFVVCLLNINTVIGGGTVLETTKKKYRKINSTYTLSYLSALQAHNVGAVVDCLLNTMGYDLFSDEAISYSTGLSRKVLQAQINARVNKGELIYFKKRGAIKRSHYEKLKKSIVEIAESIAQKNPLRKRINSKEIIDKLEAPLDEMVFQKILVELCEEGKMKKVEGGFQVKTVSAYLSEQQDHLKMLIRNFAQESKFVPFSADTFWKYHEQKYRKDEVQKMLAYMLGEKTLIRLSNHRYLSVQAMEQIKERVKEWIEKKGGLTLSESKEILGYGRTVGVYILEYLDRVGVTCREGNIRRLKNKIAVE